MGVRFHVARWGLAVGGLLIAQAGAQGGPSPMLLPDGGLQRTIAMGHRPDGAEALSELYLGMLASSDCAGVRVELALYQEGVGQIAGSIKPAAYHLRETCIDTTGPLRVMESYGIWQEVLDRGKWQAILILQDGQTSEERRFARVEDNGGTLLRLDAQMHELPANVPHALGRVTGDRQGHMMLLTEADDGRTVEMKPGEVFFLRLSRRPAPKYTAGFTWTSDRPDAMVLLESVGKFIRDTTSTSNQSFAAAKKQLPNPEDEQYQVWQLIAPQQRGQQDLQFELRHSGSATERASKVFKLSIAVP